MFNYLKIYLHFEAKYSFFCVSFVMLALFAWLSTDNLPLLRLSWHLGQLATYKSYLQPGPCDIDNGVKNLRVFFHRHVKLGYADKK